MSEPGRKPETFVRLMEAMRRIVAVPKAEVDRRAKAERKRRRKRRKG